MTTVYSSFLPWSPPLFLENEDDNTVTYHTGLWIRGLFMEVLNMVSFSHRKHKKASGSCNVYSVKVWNEPSYWNSWHFPHFTDEVTESQRDKCVGSSCARKMQPTGVHIVLVFGDGENLQRVEGWLFVQETLRRRRLLLTVVGEQFCWEILSPRIPESTTGRTWKSCRKCVLRINGGSKCWVRTFSFLICIWEIFTFPF